MSSLHLTSIIESSLRLINSSDFVLKARGDSNTNFTRNRKVNPTNICEYLLMKKGLSSKMELELFNEIVNCDISAPGMLKQREKFDPDAILFLRDNLIKDLYSNYRDHIKTWKGYLLCAIDGSEIEVPNTLTCKEEFRTSANQYKESGVARGKISNIFDVLNNIIIDTQLGEYRESERKLAIENYKSHLNLIKEYNSIFIMDRGYRSLYMMYKFSLDDDKYVMRLYDDAFREEFNQYKSGVNDITVDFNNTKCKNTKQVIYNALREHADFKSYMKEGNEFKARIVKIKLDNGKTEFLATNLNSDEASISELKQLYNMRWKIETNYHHLKESMKIEQFSSSKKRLILQEIYSQMYVQNLLQILIKESETNIEQEKYKHQMKINFNMAIGLFKNNFLSLVIEENNDKRTSMMKDMIDKMKKYIIPIRNDRAKWGTDKRRRVGVNRHSINKSKTF